MKKIILDMILKIKLTSKEQKHLNQEEQWEVFRFEKALLADTIHLEWQGIQQIDNLEFFSNIRSLLLQYILISKIENLDFLVSLESLSLEGNNIAYISGISTLYNLIYLNLANNKIVLLSLSEIPSDISILKIGGNPCTEEESYRSEVIEHFELLEELDNISVLEERMNLLGIR